VATKKEAALWRFCEELKHLAWSTILKEGELNINYRQKKRKRA
jgi:hypothetical protein